MTTLHLRKSIGRSPLRRGLLLILALCCFVLSPVPKAFGVTPAPDGGYPNGNTAEGTGALFSLTSGSYNRAMGLQALFSDTSGGRDVQHCLRQVLARARAWKAVSSRSRAGLARAYAMVQRHPGEIRVLKKDGSVENVIPFDATDSRP